MKPLFSLSLQRAPRAPLRLIAAGAIAVAAAVGAFSSAARAESFTAEQKAEINKLVHSYIVSNPEVLREAMVELEKRQHAAEDSRRREALTTERERLFNGEKSVVVGNPKGDVTIVEFFDYNCGFCKRAIADLANMLKADKNLRVVIRDFPVLGPESMQAARVALAAKQQLKGEQIFDFHLKLMETRGRIGKEQAEALAKKMGLDMARLAKDVDSPEVTAALTESRELADKLGLTGTPSFVIGDEVIPGAIGQAAMTEAVASVRKCGKAQCG